MPYRRFTLSVQAKRIDAAVGLLKWLGTHYPAVICGGYARDTICEKPIRDIDLYVCGSMFYDVKDAVAVSYPFLHECCAVEEHSDAYQHQSIHLQREFELKPDLVRRFGFETDIVNIIGLSDGAAISVQDVTSRFNLGICQAGIDTSGVITFGHFAADRQDEQITLLREDWGLEGTMRQYEKLQAKYPWPLRHLTTEDVF